MPLAANLGGCECKGRCLLVENILTVNHVLITLNSGQRGKFPDRGVADGIKMIKGLLGTLSLACSGSSEV